MDFTTFHLKSYPSISSFNLYLSNSGRTILITGGATGVGFAISNSFAESDAKRVIILGRRLEKLEEARTLLSQVLTPRTQNS